jgi:iron(III) transport system substrate-binding protein
MRIWLALIPLFIVGGLLALLELHSHDADASTPRLILISPQGGDTQHEFDAAFSAWHQKKYGSPVKIIWADVGGNGTGNIITALTAEYKNAPTSGYDIAFGGGSATFNDYLERGFLEKPPLPDATLHQVPADIFGTPLHGKNDLWIAATMSNFGIVLNKDRLHELGLAMPTTWADLAVSQWFNSLSLADPSKSGSVRSGYEMIFQQYGWQKAWALLTLMFANAAELRDVGSAPAEDVGSAQAVAGIVIDFFGRKEVARVGSSLVAFVVPQGGSTIDTDPVAMLKGAPHAELAAHFIEFVISPEGQRLWTLRAGTPGGPERHALGRMSILPALYTTDAANMLDPTNPFTAPEHLHEDLPAKKARTAFLGDLVKSTLIDNHNALLAARAAILAAGDPPDLLAQLTAPPTYLPLTLDDKSHLVEASPLPITDALEDQRAVAQLFKPDPRSPLAGFSEQLQARLKDHWRAEAAARYAQIKSLADTHSHTTP